MPSQTEFEQLCEGVRTLELKVEIIKNNMESEAKVSDGYRCDVREKLDFLTRCLVGGGDDPSRGIVVRLDRVEQNMKHCAWSVKTMAAALVGLIVEAIRKIVIGHA